MGAGGGRCDGARVELRRPGLSAGGMGISMDFSTGRGTDNEVGASLVASGAAGALPAFAGGATAEGDLAGGFEVGLIVVPGVVLGFTLDAATGFLGVASGTGFAAALLFTATGLTALTALAATFGATFTAVFCPEMDLAGALTAALAAVFALPAFATGFTTGFGTGLVVALPFRPVLTAALAGVADFCVTAFTGCLLWEAASG